jgi:hypothetical protein
MESLKLFNVIVKVCIFSSCNVWLELIGLLCDKLVLQVCSQVSHTNVVVLGGVEDKRLVHGWVLGGISAVGVGGHSHVHKRENGIGVLGFSGLVSQQAMEEFGNSVWDSISFIIDGIGDTWVQACRVVANSPIFVVVFDVAKLGAIVNSSNTNKALNSFSKRVPNINWITFMKIIPSTL